MNASAKEYVNGLTTCGPDLDGQGVSYKGGEECVFLDGHFTADELQEIINHMRSTQ